MKNGYYYIISSLPELNLSDKNLEYDMLSFREYVSELLEEVDFKMLKILYYPYDIPNFINLIKANGAAWDARGNYTREAFDAMLMVPDTLPVFLQQFYDETRPDWEKTSEKELINTATSLFIDWSRTVQNPFLKKWLYFDQNLKNLLIWLNSNKFDMKPNEEVLGENYEAEYLRATNADDLNLHSWDLPFKEALTHFDNPNVALREYLIDQMRWKYLDELEENYAFGIERLMAFVIKLQIINRNIVTTEEAGRERLEQLLQGIRKEYEMPETFN